MARPKGFKQGGGFLNQVDGVITGYEFTTVFPGETKVSAKKKKGNDDWHPLYCILSARQDGADEDVTTTLMAGSADDFAISDGGRTLTPVEDGVGLRATSGWAKLVQSIVDSDVDGKVDTEQFYSDSTEDAISFETLVGLRVRFEQKVNEEATKKYGKRKSKDGKKEYNRTDLIVSAVYGVQEVKQKGKAPSSVAKGSKANGKASATVDADEAAVLAAYRYLEAAKDNAIPKAKLRMKVLTDATFKEDKDLRDNVLKRLADDEFLAGISDTSYDPSDKNPTLAAA